MATDRDRSDWQSKYESSIRDENERNADDDANESEWSRLFNRAAYTDTALDLVFLPFVLLLCGLPALYRHVRRPGR